MKPKVHTSKMITVSAVSRLIPRPPALVERRKAKSGEPGALKCSIDFFRTSEGTVPKTISANLKEDDNETHHRAAGRHNLALSCSLI